METATKRKVSELEGTELDFWVAKAEGVTSRSFQPQYSWAEGGPIIEREGIGVARVIDSTDWIALPNGEWGPHVYRSPTALIAAMRCFVASKFGEYVEG